MATQSTPRQTECIRAFGARSRGSVAAWFVAAADRVSRATTFSRSAIFSRAAMLVSQPSFFPKHARIPVIALAPALRQGMRCAPAVSPHAGVSPHVYGARFGGASSARSSRAAYAKEGASGSERAFVLSASLAGSVPLLLALLLMCP